MAGLVVEKPNMKYWIRYIHQRIEKNKNFLGFVSGPTGSGKSWCSLRIGEDLDPNFDISRVVFSGLELMDLVNNGNLKSGDVIVFEEVGIEMSNKNWQSIINKMLNYLIQTFRHRNIILILNSPFMDFVDASTRKLFHAEFITNGIDFKAKTVKLDPKLIQYSSRTRKFYFKYLRLATKTGVVPVISWTVGKPTKELLEKYEIKKRAFTNDLNRTIYQELLKAKAKKTESKKLICVNCGYEWSVKCENPKQCPRCRKKPILNQKTSPNKAPLVITSQIP